MIKLKIILGFVIGVVIICFTAVYFFTRNTLFKSLDLTNTGQIGDTIGGITSPIIGSIGAILVYLSFKQQFEANEIQKTALKNAINDGIIQTEISQIEKLFEMVKSEINSMTLVSIREIELSNIQKRSFDRNYEQFNSQGLFSLLEFVKMINARHLTEGDKATYLRQVNHILYLIRYAEKKVLDLKSKNVEIEFQREIIKSYYKNILEHTIIHVLSAVSKRDLASEDLLRQEFEKLRNNISYLSTIFNEKL